MAYTTPFIAREKTLLKGAGARISHLLAALGAYLIDSLEAKARMREVMRLHAMTEAELAAQGLTRDDIVGHVFRDKFCY